MTPIAWVHGALTSFVIALVVLAAQSWPTNEHDGGCLPEDVGTTCCFGCCVVTYESACDDYAPIAPLDGAWCGVRLDDRYPLRDDSFPTIEIETPSASSP